MCSVLFAGLRQSLRSLEFSPTPRTHESLALIYSAGYSDRSFLEYITDGANKAARLYIQARAFVSLDHKSMQPSETNKINNCQKL